MSQELDNQIAALEKQLLQLRRQKLEALQAQVAALRSSLGEGEAPASNGRRSRGIRRGMSDSAVPAAAPQRRRGVRRKHRRFTEEDAIAALTEAVRAAGKAGIPGKQASVASGVSYPRAMQLLGANFKRNGSGKWTRFTLK